MFDQRANGSISAFRQWVIDSLRWVKEKLDSNDTDIAALQAEIADLKARVDALELL